MVAVAAFVKWGLTCVFNVEGVTIDRVSTACPFLAVVAAVATVRFASEADNDVTIVHRRIDSVSGYLAGHAVDFRVNILKAGER
jgi:hypothetical protein